MKRIVIHWTAGGYAPTDYEKQFYHYLVDDKGNVHSGKYKPEDNLNVNNGKYAAHTGGRQYWFNRCCNVRNGRI